MFVFLTLSRKATLLFGWRFKICWRHHYACGTKETFLENFQGKFLSKVFWISLKEYFLLVYRGSLTNDCVSIVVITTHIQYVNGVWWEDAYSV